MLVLTISKKDIPIEFQDDTAKLIGCINALSKNLIGDSYNLLKFDPISIAMRNILSYLKLNVEELFSKRNHFFKKLYESVKKE